MASAAKAAADELGKELQSMRQATTEAVKRATRLSEELDAELNAHAVTMAAKEALRAEVRGCWDERAGCVNTTACIVDGVRMKATGGGRGIDEKHVAVVVLTALSPLVFDL